MKKILLLILSVAATAIVAISSPVRSMLSANETEIIVEDDFPENPTAADYIQDGLIALWDAEENVGFGMHETSPMVWKNLVGNGLDMVSNGTPFFYDNYMASTNRSQLWHTDVTDLMDEVIQTGSFTFQIVVSDTNHYCVGWFIFGGGNYNDGASLWPYTTKDSIGSRRNIRGSIGQSTSAAYNYSTDSFTASLVSENGRFTTYKFTSSGQYAGNVVSITPPLPYVSKRFTIGYRFNSIGANPMVHGEKIYCIRVYDRALTYEEIQYNANIDFIRFGFDFNE